MLRTVHSAGLPTHDRGNATAACAAVRIAQQHPVVAQRTPVPGGRRAGVRASVDRQLPADGGHAAARRADHCAARDVARQRNVHPVVRDQLVHALPARLHAAGGAGRGAADDGCDASHRYCLAARDAVADRPPAACGRRGRALEVAGDPVQLRVRVLLGLPVVPRRRAAGAGTVDPDRSLRRAADAEIGPVDRAVRQRPVLLPHHRARFRLAHRVRLRGGQAVPESEGPGAAVAAVRGSRCRCSRFGSPSRWAGKRPCRTVSPFMASCRNASSSCWCNRRVTRARNCCSRRSSPAPCLLLPLLAGCSFSRKPERWLPFVLGFAVFMLAPRYVFTTAYFFHRLGAVPGAAVADGLGPAARRGATSRLGGHRHRAVVVFHDHRPLRGLRGRDGKLPQRRGARGARPQGWLDGVRERQSVLRAADLHAFPGVVCSHRRRHRRFQFRGFHLATGPLSQGCRQAHDRRAGLVSRRSSIGASTAASATTTS